MKCRLLNLCTFEAQSNLGAISGQEVGEFIPLEALDKCPADYELELSLEMLRGAKRASNSDLLFYTYTEGTTCIDFDTLTFRFAGQAEFLDGTGIFTGATGSIDVTSHGTVVAVDPVGKGLSAITLEAEGTLILASDGLAEADCNDDGVVNGADLVGAGCDD